MKARDSVSKDLMMNLKMLGDFDMVIKQNKECFHGFNDLKTDPLSYTDYSNNNSDIKTRILAVIGEVLHSYKSIHLFNLLA